MFFTGELSVPAAYLHQTCEVLGSGRQEAVGGMKDKGCVRVCVHVCVRACERALHTAFAIIVGDNYQMFFAFSDERRKPGSCK